MMRVGVSKRFQDVYINELDRWDDEGKRDAHMAGDG